MRQIAAEEAQELARLTLEHAAEKRALRSSALLSMVTAHRADRRNLRQRNRRQRLMAAIVLQPVRNRVAVGTSASRKHVRRNIRLQRQR